MKAIVVSEFGTPGVMNVTEIPLPEPGVGQVRVKIDAAGVNPVDSYIRAGMYPVLPSLPYTPGMDGAGTVDAVGPEANQWSVGDPVYLTRSVSGTYAEYAICQQDTLHRLPGDISADQGAAIGVPGGAAWRSLFDRGGARPGEKLLVHGASGSVGLFAIQLARMTGMEVFGTAGSQAGKTLVCKFGAFDTFNHRDEAYQEQLMAATAGKGFDLILEMLANVNLERDLEMLAPRGRIVIVGSRGRIEIDPRLTMGKETDIRGMSLFNSTLEEDKQIHAGLCGAIASGAVTPVINTVVPLEEAAAAHEKVLMDGNLGKMVLRP